LRKAEEGKPFGDPGNPVVKQRGCEVTLRKPISRRSPKR
jgi:hypothetical protein